MSLAIYVSPNGNDSNGGSQDSPFATIAAASKAAQPGTTIHVAPGTYAGGFETTASGTASAPITYVSDVPNGAKIVGGGSATNPNQAGWENAGNYVNIQGFEVDGSGSQAKSWAFGLYNGASHVTFQGNKVHDIMTDSGAYASLTSSGNGGAGIMMDSYYGGADGNVTGNVVYNIGPSGTTSTLVHGIYQTESGKVERNVVHDVVGDGLTSWHNAKDISFINNTIDEVGGTGVLVGSNGSGTGGGFVVENNIVSNAANGIYEEGTTGSNNTYTDNLLHNISGTQSHLQNGLTASGTLSSNPDYVNAGGGNYQLQAGSPAINAGTSDGASTVDCAGNTAPQQGAYDLGAYEYMGSASTPASTPVTTSMSTSVSDQNSSATSTPTSDATTVSPDKLSLVLSEAQGAKDVQFIVKLDGNQIGGPTSVTADHGSGESNTFSYSGDWGAGTHDLQIELLDGSSTNYGTSADLYATQVTYNGTDYLLRPEMVHSAGTIDLMIGK
jgi:hypothetical protein